MTSSAVYNKDIAERIWTGKIPLQITLDTRNLQEVFNVPVNTEEQFIWNPIYLEASRCSYLPLVTDHIYKLISQLERHRLTDSKRLEEKFRNAWYDCSGIPLKWHYPIGLLYDIHSTSTTSTSSEIWTLTLHFDDLPTDQILEKPTVDTMRELYMSIMKEADFLLHGSIKKVMNLSKKDTTQLWQGVMEDAFDEFYAVNRNLRPTATTALSSASASPSNNQLRHVPLKIYLAGRSPVIQELISFTDHQQNGDEAEQRSPTIENVLKQAIPELTFPLDPALVIMLHGIEIPLDIPVVWAYENLAYADNFLHIVIKYK